MKHLTDTQLNEYLDHALGETTRGKFDSHLQTCADCKTRLDELIILFTSLEALPEVKLRRDLSPSILARLSPQQPRVRTPFFAAQVGAALGVLFWLSMQFTKFIPTDFSVLRFPQFSIPTFPLPTPHSLLPSLYSLFSNPYPLLTILHPSFSIPTFNLPASQLSTFQVAFVSIGALALWVIGNVTLLQNCHETQK